MFAALIAVVMVIGWIWYIAMTVLVLTGGTLTSFVVWVVATPIVLGLEALGWAGLERFGETTR